MIEPPVSFATMPSVKVESESETNNNTLVPPTLVDALPRHMRKARASGHAVLPLLESDSEENNDDSDYKPSSYVIHTVQKQSSRVGVQGRQRKSNLTRKIRALVRIGNRIELV